MNDEQLKQEVEKTLLDLSDACRDASTSITRLEVGETPEHLVDAMRTALGEMTATHERLQQAIERPIRT